MGQLIWTSPNPNCDMNRQYDTRDYTTCHDYEDNGAWNSMIFDQSRCPGMQLAQYQGMGCSSNNFKMCFNLDVPPTEGNGCDKCVPMGQMSWKYVCNRGDSGATPTGSGRDGQYGG